MYNHQIDYFILAAKEGSFTKASQKMMLSPAAFIKHINNLEDRLGIKLFERTTHGVTLTPAGEIVYTAAQKMISVSNQALTQAKELESNAINSIKIGNSLLYPSQPLFDYLLPLLNQNPDIKLQIVSIPNSTSNADNPVSMLGDQIDIFAGIFPSDMWGHSCNGLKLMDLPLRIAVPRNNKLAQKDHINLSNLRNQTLYMVEPNNTSYIDEVRDQLKQDYPQIQIKNIPPYDIDTFNRVVADNKLIITVDLWKNAHPSLKILPVDWNYTVPWGIVYGLEASKKVTAFLLKLRSIQKNTQ